MSGFGSIYKESWWGSPVKGGWGHIYYDLARPESELSLRFQDRVETAGGVIESIECVNSADFNNYEWDFYFRVIDAGGTVESLECVAI